MNNPANDTDELRLFLTRMLMEIGTDRVHVKVCHGMEWYREHALSADTMPEWFIKEADAGIWWYQIRPEALDFIKGNSDETN